MTDAQDHPAEPQLPAFEPAPSPAALRAELEALVIGDLHGPAGGELEQIPGRGRVSERYITGLLAPRQSLATDPERTERSAATGGNTAASDDSGSDDSESAAKPTLFPSSLGVSFTVADGTESLLVTASWGRYAKQEATQGSGDESTVWQRTPMSGTVAVPVAAGDVEPANPVPEQPDVWVRGKVTRLDSGWLVSLFLVNDQDTPAQNKDEAWLFQASLSVAAPGEEPVFRGRDDVLGNQTSGEVDELALLDLQYRNRVEFAVGHGTATHAYVDPSDPTRAFRVETTAVPVHEVPVTEAPGPDDPSRSEQVRAALDGVVLDMSTLAALDGTGLVAAVSPLVDAYEVWLGEQEQRLATGSDRLADHQDAATSALAEARTAAGRLREGISLLAPVDGKETDAAEAFRFANHTMWQQRVHTLAADRRRDDQSVELAAALTEVDVPRNRSWRPFQLAFLLLNLPSLNDPTHPERTRESGLVDLLFFPTGGGKTEAYLGLTAFTLAIRRLQGTVAGRDGRSGGVAVLMRYTLRLLTAQQFERAAALICACEVRRRELVAKDDRWGTEPFRLGMWVGSNVTPNRTKDAAYAIEEAASAGKKRNAASSAVQLVSCPWCGTRLNDGRDAKTDVQRWRTLLFCGEQFGTCPFTAVNSPGEGLPVVTVDEELYRLLPSFIISTADKFAQLPWRGPLHVLFGNVTRRCERHGYRSPDLDTIDSQRPERDSHNATGPKAGNLPAAKTVDVVPLRPPDLIIQDELHLISGPLGTLVGLYETAIDELATWDVDGTPVRPKVVASTATVRRAAEQAHALFARRLAVFPTPVLDVSDSFFAKERSTQDRAGRRYLGICAPGLRLKSAEVRVFTALLSSAQRLYERYGAAADPWMTLVGYFSALRELAGARRLVDDEIKNAVYRADRRGLGRRSIRRSGVEELTSRVSSGDIRDVLDRLKQKFDPEAEGTYPIDVLLATNMISVGVDVGRLGVMCAVGQPKTTSEYIQATSRVGRSQDGPGLVVTLYNWSRPRDLSHYETFEHYHSTFYRQVEALSVTPFSPRALDRGLSAVLVALARQEADRSVWSPSAWNPNEGAQRVVLNGPELDAIVERIVSRAEQVTSDVQVGDLVRALLQTRLDRWSTEQNRPGSTLGYAEDPKNAIAPLLDVPGIATWDLFTCPWSLRETEPTVNLIINPDDRSLGDAPDFELGKGASRRSGRDTVGDEEPLVEEVDA